MILLIFLTSLTELLPGILIQDKRIGIFFWAHFRRFAPETGLSAPIPQPLRGLRDFRFNPLRIRKEPR
jgi:hypothetical protein